MLSSKLCAKFDVLSLKQWFLVQKREFPWRKNPTPYQVWVSEVLLQQTQASVVVPYFNRWMELFPTLETLAKASLDQVIKAVEGIGYYSRIRHIHAAAVMIANEHEGKIPDAKEKLQKIKGLGSYTIGAILSFAFHQKEVAIDANVMRVISRYFLIEDPVARQSAQKEIRQRVEMLLPDVEPWVITEALIELGACICKKQPQCAMCPLKKGCLGFQTGKAPLLPVKHKKNPVSYLKRFVGILLYNREVLLRKGPSGKVMADLYEFPYFDAPFARHPLAETAYFECELPMVKHSFTRYQAELYPTVWRTSLQISIKDYMWVPFSRVEELAFSSGHRRIWRACAPIVQ